VGDILKVEDTHKFAADMVILSTSASTGKFFVMTANLDGETNLKPMSAARLTKHCRVSHTGRKVTVKSSVADPDPNPDQDPLDPHVFGPPGSGSISQRYGSGSFYYHAKMVRKTLTFFLRKMM
jgi:magnesium-transporting ATPase (P-type)